MDYQGILLRILSQTPILGYGAPVIRHFRSASLNRQPELRDPQVFCVFRDVLFEG